MIYKGHGLTVQIAFNTALKKAGIKIASYIAPQEITTDVICTVDTTKHDEEIQNKTIDEMSQIIRKNEADTSHCLFDCPKADEPITCTICVLERAVEQMKGETE